MMTPSKMKSYATRLDADTGDALAEAADFTGLRIADLLREGAKMVLHRIKQENGLHLGRQRPTTKKSKPSKCVTRRNTSRLTNLRPTPAGILKRSADWLCAGCCRRKKLLV